MIELLLGLIFPVVNYYLAKKRARNIYLWIVLGFLFSFISTIILYVLKDYSNYISVDEYLANHPEINNGNGIKCIKCGSNHINSRGLSNADDHRRIHSCNSCGERLYKSGF
jgi:hypothetical protein